jgi:cytochrome c553
MRQTTKPARIAVPLLGMLLVGGCTWGFGGGDGDVPAMHRNLSKTVDIQTGVVQGDLEKARQAAHWLLEQKDAMIVPPEGAEHQQAMLTAAARIMEATELRAAATQTGHLAGGCGSCHQAVDAGPRFVMGNTAPNGTSQEAQMIRHLWAADRMWEGLVGPSDEAWRAGAEAMAETQPVLARVFRASASMAEPEGFLREINLLANEATAATTLAGRADVYGRLLTTCNRCHTPAGIMVEK